YLAAQLADVPGQTLTLPTLLVASGIRYLASGVNPERAAPLLSPAAATRAQLSGAWTTYPQLYWWEGPDGSRVLHWRSDQYADGARFGFDVGPTEMARRLSEWLLTDPVLLSAGYPYDVVLLCGALSADGLLDEAVVANVEEFNRRYAYPRLIAARPEEFFREVEQRWGAKVAVRRGDTGCYREDGTASAAAELARYRAAQLAARAAELLALWDERTEPPDPHAADRIARRAEQRRRMWRDLLMFGDHHWVSGDGGTDPDGGETVAQWAYKRDLLERGAAAAADQVAAALLRIGLSSTAGTGRVVCNAPPWPPTDVAPSAAASGRRAPDCAGARRAPDRTRSHGEAGDARGVAARAPARHRHPPRGRAGAAGLYRRHDRRDAVRRPAVDGHREPGRQTSHVGQGSPLRRVPVRSDAAHRRGGGPARPHDGGARPATWQLPGLVLPCALGVAARRRGRDPLERARHAALHPQRHFPGPVAPHDRARRHPVRLRAAQL